jgi:ribosomal protein L7Ae-like RNA K-turn-binding protein
VALDDAARRKLLGLVGLGVRGRLVVVGVQQVRDAATRDKLVLALVATDVSRHSLDKIVPLLRARRVRYVEVPSAAELGAAVGKESTAAIGVVDRDLARGMTALIAAPVRDATESDPVGVQ